MYALVVAVLPDPKTADNSLHWSEAGTYMCWPVLVPQITGGAEIKVININNQFVTSWSWIIKKWKLHFAPGAVIEKVSTSQFPKLFAVPDQRCWQIFFWKFLTWKSLKTPKFMGKDKEQKLISDLVNFFFSPSTYIYLSSTLSSTKMQKGYNSIFISFPKSLIKRLASLKISWQIHTGICPSMDISTFPL